MALELKPISVIKAHIGIQPNGPIHKWFTNTCALHMDKYTPWRTGKLAETVVVNGKVNEANVTTDKIIYNQDYAVYVYYPTRNGKALNYRKNVHEKAGGYWDKRMWSAEKDKIIQEVQNYINKHGGN